jgi:hypothetical protein
MYLRRRGGGRHCRCNSSDEMEFLDPNKTTAKKKRSLPIQYSLYPVLILGGACLSSQYNLYNSEAEFLNSLWFLPFNYQNFKSKYGNTFISNVIMIFG